MTASAVSTTQMTDSSPKLARSRPVRPSARCTATAAMFRPSATAWAAAAAYSAPPLDGSAPTATSAGTNRASGPSRISERIAESIAGRPSPPRGMSLSAAFSGPAWAIIMSHASAPDAAA